MNILLESNLNLALYSITLANLGIPPSYLLNNIDRTNTHELQLAKFFNGIAFGGILYGVNNTILKGRLSVLVLFTPLAMTMGTSVIAQLTKNFQQEKIFAVVDKYSDQLLEMAFSVASLACWIFCAMHLKHSVSVFSLKFAVSAYAVGIKIYYVASPYLMTSRLPFNLNDRKDNHFKKTQEEIDTFLKSKNIHTGLEPFIDQSFDINSLGINLNEKAVFQVYDKEKFKYVKKKIKLIQAVDELIDEIDKCIQNNHRETSIEAKRTVYVHLDKGLFKQYHKHQWLPRVIDTLINKGSILESYFDNYRYQLLV